MTAPSTAAPAPGPVAPPAVASARERALTDPEKAALGRLGNGPRIVALLFSVFSLGWGLGGVGGSPLDPVAYMVVALLLALFALIVGRVARKGRAAARALAQAGIGLDVAGGLRDEGVVGKLHRLEIGGVRLLLTAAGLRRLTALRPTVVTVVGGGPATKGLDATGANGAVVSADGSLLARAVPVTVETWPPEVEPGGTMA